MLARGFNNLPDSYADLDSAIVFETPGCLYTPEFDLARELLEYFMRRYLQGTGHVTSQRIRCLVCNEEELTRRQNDKSFRPRLFVRAINGTQLMPILSKLKVRLPQETLWLLLKRFWIQVITIPSGAYRDAPSFVLDDVCRAPLLYSLIPLI